MLPLPALLLLCSLSQTLSSPVGQQQVFSAPDEPLTIDWSDDRVISSLRAHIEAFPERRLVRIARNGLEETHETTEGEKALLTAKGLKFVDVTENQDMWESETPPVQAYSYPKTMSVGRIRAENYYKNISTSRMKATLSEFSGSFRTRYYRSSDGKKSQEWLLGQVRGIAKQHPTAKIEVTEFVHSWGQNTIIARIPKEGSDYGQSKDGPVVILGAHQDSTNLLPFLSAPGADDDGSGTTTVLETFSSLVANGFQPKNHTLELHWYSAEEGGLLGSQAVAAAYKQAGQKVRAMLQLDMTAVTKPGRPEQIGVIQDFVDPDLTAFLENIAAEYADIPVVQTKCGYGCSDHASWNKVGVPSAFAIEAAFEETSHVVHTTQDTIYQPGFSFKHMQQFAYLALGFVLELA